MGEAQRAEVLVDFQNLPLLPAVEILRALGDHLFSDLMAHPARLAWPEVWKGDVPTLPSNRKFWRQSFRQKLRNKLPLGKRFHKFLQKRNLRKMMRGKLKWEQYRKDLGDGIQAEFSQVTSMGLTPEMWKLAGEAAWLGPRFQHPINRILDSRLRGEVLLTGGKPPLVAISAPAIWALIALAAAQPLRRGEKRKMSRPLRRLRRDLAKVAENQALGQDWAGFWDQWLLSRALPLVKRRFPTNETTLLQALMALPFREALGTKALPPHPLPPRFWPAKWWWYLCLGWRRFGEQWRGIWTREPQSLPNLADPQWHHNLPSWAEKFDPIGRNLNGGSMNV